MYQFMVRSDETNRYNRSLHQGDTIYGHDSLMVDGKSPANQLWLEHHYLGLASDVYSEIEGC